MKVIECGGFTHAAKELGYSQSAVSQTVAALETELGTRLLIRSREGIALTQDGETYLPFIRSIVSAEENLEQKKQEMHGLHDTLIRIGAFTSVTRNLLPELMSSFRSLYPETRFELRQGEYNDIHDWIMAGEVDFGFISPKNFQDLQTDEIYHDSMRAVLPEDSPLAARRSVSLKDLCEAPFILLDEGEHSVPLEAFAACGLQPNIAYKVYDDYSILAMVRRGMGISVLYSLVTAGFEAGLSVIPIREPVERTIALACRSRQTMPYAAGKFYDYIKKEVPDVLRDLSL